MTSLITDLDDGDIRTEWRTEAEAAADDDDAADADDDAADSDDDASDPGGDADEADA
jgi:hypothetical protein